jgi:hypothetical protein
MAASSFSVSDIPGILVPGLEAGKSMKSVDKVYIVLHIAFPARIYIIMRNSPSYMW